MGNQLVGIAPSQIFPVEHYLTELAEFQFDVNLGSTRFMKVARAKSQEGLIVVKVFVIHDPTLPLSSYRDKLEELRHKLASAVNCLPFQKTLLTDKAGFIMRECVKYSLYDRISTRPFLSTVEKKWIAFQVLYALHQCHKLGVCHGDIKLENIMITSWNWVLLTDFASYKPTYLPEDNPADFSYFFDTSRRRTCYIAPERFVKTLSSDITSQLLLPEEDIKKGDLMPTMDIFSAGCALTELFSDGHPPFDFSQLLAYRSGEYNTSKVLERLDDPGIRELLRNMMEKDPSLRLSAETILAQQRDKIFPEYFYSFLQSYMLIFSSAPILSSDEKISRLRKDIKNIVKILQCEEEKENSEDANKTDNQRNGMIAEGLVIITSLVTSCIRGLHHCSSKLYCLEILVELSMHTSSETILDRILPYIFHLLEDNEPRVRVMSIHCLTRCLAAVQTVPCSDANIFPEYALPNLASIYQDEAVLVRAAYAENIAQLAETALRFLEQSQQDVNISLSEGHVIPSYETELNTLTEMIQQTVAMLLKDPENLVRRTLLENGITRLCVFFGKQKAHDILLSHMITFLNDKEDKHLRGTFFESIIGVATYVGWHGTTVLLPLLQQGLSDPEEFVMIKAINAITSLTELGLITKLTLYNLLRDMVCFLLHPNLWVRHAIVGFISSVSRTVDLVDVQSKLMSVVQPYLTAPLIQVDQEVLLLRSLKPPIPRIVYDSIVKCSDINLLLQTLRERHDNREQLLAHHLLTPTVRHTLQTLLIRLDSEGMTEIVEEQLLAMSDHLKKLHHRHAFLQDHKHQIMTVDGEISLSSDKLRHICVHNVTLIITDVKGDASGLIHAKTRPKKPSTFLYEAHASIVMNEEWQHMFGSTETQCVQNSKTTESDNISPTGGASGSNGSGTLASPLVDNVHLVSPQQSIDVEHSIQEKSYIQHRCAPCKSELRELLVRKQEQYVDASKTMRSMSSSNWGLEPVSWERKNLLPPGWRVRGVLVAHLHEHRGAINRLVSIPTTSLFASCSTDGFIRVWDSAKMEGRNFVNRSCQFYNRMGDPLIGLTVCDNKQSLGCSSLNGSVFVARIDSCSSKLTVLQSKQLDAQEEGCAVDINFFDSGSQSVLVYATMYGSVIGWDVRSPTPAWKLDNDLKHGVITSFCLDSRQCWLTVGTSSGYHICWDLRFHLPISTILHPNGARVRRLLQHPTAHSCVLSAVQGNNEVSMWNLETGLRQNVLWASSTPPLSQTVSPYSVCSMFAGVNDRAAPFLITGGSDMRLRFWDLESPSDSYIAVPAANDSITPNSVLYKSRLVDGTDVVQEVSMKHTKKARGLHTERGVSLPTSNVGPAGDIDSPRAGPEQPANGHHDWISDVILSHASQQCFIVTGSRDGVIKLWK